MSCKYKHIDREGAEILNAISYATNFNKWMYKCIEPFCHGKILELGSGVGNISSFFLDAGKDITVSDIRPGYRKALGEKFNLPSEKVIDIDLVQSEFKTKYETQLEKYDCVFALNVVEHIENDGLALANMYSLLKPGGKMLVLVPAHQNLYNQIDLTLEHYRRYNKKSLRGLMEKLAPVKTCFYFNAVGIAAWWIGGKLLNQKTIPESEMKLYDIFVPLFKIIDKLVGNKIGLSVVCVIQK